MKLEDMTKGELLNLIRSRWPQPTENDLITARFNSLHEKGQQLRTDAIDTMRLCALQRDTVGWFEANKQFDKGVALSEEADRLFRQVHP